MALGVAFCFHFGLADSLQGPLAIALGPLLPQEFIFFLPGKTAEVVCVLAIELRIEEWAVSTTKSLIKQQKETKGDLIAARPHRWFP